MSKVLEDALAEVDKQIAAPRGLSKVDVPARPVTQSGCALLRLDGSREVSYVTDDGTRYLCVTDGVTRQWYLDRRPR